jgi:hypothetical protein
LLGSPKAAFWHHATPPPVIMGWVSSRGEKEAQPFPPLALRRLRVSGPAASALIASKVQGLTPAWLRVRAQLGAKPLRASAPPVSPDVEGCGWNFQVSKGSVFVGQNLYSAPTSLSDSSHSPALVVS